MGADEDVGEGMGVGLDEGEGGAMRLKVYPHPSTPELLISGFLPVLFI
jgi:hypothetical protein